MANISFKSLYRITAIVAVIAFILLALFYQPQRDRQRAAPKNGADKLQSEQRRGAWVDEIVFTQEPDTGKAVNLIENDRIQLFAAGISNPTIFQRIQQSSETDFDTAYGSSVELTINPAQFHNDSELNPFQSRAIREALNWLIDRDYIAEELYGGLAVPRYLPLDTPFPDYARLARTARELELHYSPDQKRAEQIINREMKELGAQKRQGTWMYEGDSIELSIIIRTEDIREQVGDYIANLMSDMGFDVHRMYRNAEEASRIWIGTDPKAGEWHLYTGGWSTTLINRDLAGQFDAFYTPRGRPLPLWQAYNPSEEFDKIAERLQRRDYQDWDERQKLMARALKLSMKESYRIWLVDTKSVWPKAPEVNVSADLAAGVGGSYLWPYTLRYEDRTGGSMTISTPSFLTEPWNPVAGSNWIFDQMIMRALDDPSVLPDPFTGLFRPQRVAKAEVTVQEGVPVNQTLDWVELKRKDDIEVPEDAWVDWDQEAKRFTTADEKYPDGVSARTRTRVTYESDYLERKWHDGTSLGVADIVLPWILTFVRGEEKSQLYDRSHVPALSTFRKYFRGWRIVSQSPLQIDIYSDQIFPDVEWIAGNRIPGATAWHTLALGIRAERNNELAFSSDKADQLAIEWMNFVAGPSLSILDRLLRRAREEHFIPFPNVLNEFVDREEAKARYDALTKWREEKGHFWVGNGPFYLENARPVEGTVVLRRFEDFRDPADKWVGFDEPYIPVVNVEGPKTVTVGDSADFTVEITHDGGPYKQDAIAEISYMFFDSKDNLVAEGQAEPSEEAGTWHIPLNGEKSEELGTGANSLEVAVRSNRVALPSFGSLAFGTIPE